MKKLFLLCLLVGMVLIPQAARGQNPPFYLGVDLSYVNEMEDCGAVYREQGVPVDPFALFEAHGATLVRARLWHTPDWTTYSTLEDVKKTFSRAHAQGMATLLDIHYSDNWADPSRQEIPAAWQNIEDEDELAQAIYEYTVEVLTALYKADLMPTFVQVGNETNSGMLKRDVKLEWGRDAKLFKAGIRAVRDVAATTQTHPQVMLHVAQPENTGWWFTEAETAGITDFDVIGISYYPQWSTFSIADMGAQVSYLRQRFGKEVMVVETGYPWTREAVDETAANVLLEGLRGYSFTPAGQHQFMVDLTQSLISNGALGVVYWEPAWVSTPCYTRWGQGSHWENATFFDFQQQNEVHEGIEFLNYPYLYPSQLVDGQLEAEYGEPLILDGTGDVLNQKAALDGVNLHGRESDQSLFLALSIAGDIYSENGSYLFYFDTTQDTAGATLDPTKRPVTVADPFKPEYRLDISIVETKGTVGGSYVLNVWQEGEWKKITFTGGAAIQARDTSLIEIQMPLALLGNPSVLNLAVISTGRGRIQTAADILGSDLVPAASDTPITLDHFYPFDLSAGD